MTEGRMPKGEPEPPDTGTGTGTTTAAQKRKMEPADEADVQAYQEQPNNAGASEDTPASMMGEPEPPDTGTSGTD